MSTKTISLGIMCLIRRTLEMMCISTCRPIRETLMEARYQLLSKILIISVLEPLDLIIQLMIIDEL